MPFSNEKSLVKTVFQFKKYSS